MKLLHIDASPRTVRSVTRKLSSGFVQALRLKYPGLRVTLRDVVEQPLREFVSPDLVVREGQP